MLCVIVSLSAHTTLVSQAGGPSWCLVCWHRPSPLLQDTAFGQQPAEPQAGVASLKMVCMSLGQEVIFFTPLWSWGTTGRFSSLGFYYMAGLLPVAFRYLTGLILFSLHITQLLTWQISATLLIAVSAVQPVLAPVQSWSLVPGIAVPGAAPCQFLVTQC